jgi:hypothetical protein
MPSQISVSATPGLLSTILRDCWASLLIALGLLFFRLLVLDLGPLLLDRADQLFRRAALAMLVKARARSEQV